MCIPISYQKEATEQEKYSIACLSKHLNDGLEYEMSQVLGLLSIIILISFPYVGVYFSFRASAIDNAYAIDKGTCSANDTHCIPEEEFSKKACNDGVDNDQDGKIDSKDPDCGVTNSPPQENNKPKANAGPDQSVKSGDTVQLDGTKSYDPDCRDNANSDDCSGEIEYDWQQTGHGPQIKDWEGIGVYDSKPSFIAPSIKNTVKITIALKVYSQNQWSSPDYLVITVKPAVEQVPLPGNQLGIKINVQKNQINIGDKQTVVVTAFDKSSNKMVMGSSIKGKVTFQNRDVERFSGNDGEVTHSWYINANSHIGTFKVSADVSAKGYNSISDSASFKVNKKKVHQNNDPTTKDPTTKDPTTKDPTTNDHSDARTTWIGLLAIIAVAAILGGYAKHRSSKKHFESRIKVMTRGGMEE